MALLFGFLTLIVWFVLIFGRGRYWLVEPPVPYAEDMGGMTVAVVIPARDEAETIGRTVGSILAQDYAGPLSIILVDDQSTDGTAQVAHAAAEAIGAGDRLTILSGQDLPDGWSGKLWALEQGVARAAETAPHFILLTDADIVHAPANIRRLVTRAVIERLDLLSQMVLLRCESWAERAFIPAFVYFFFMIYPPRWVADETRGTAAAAGGCVLIRPDALTRAGGLAAIKGALIDDCSLAAAVKARGGRVRLDVTNDARSIRAYPGWRDIWRMVTRTAFTQLDYSPWLLAGTLVGLILTFVLPPWLALYGRHSAWLAGLIAWAMMTASMAPTLRLYGRWWVWGLALPLVALFYAAATVGSAVAYWRGQGGMWKGRVQAR